MPRKTIPTSGTVSPRSVTEGTSDSEVGVEVGALRKGKPAYTPAEREERWKTCAKYIRRYPASLADAKAAAKRDGVSFDTSVWLTAVGKMMEGKL